MSELKREIVVVEGVFSKLSITLSDSVISELAMIQPEDNPVVKATARLKRALKQFERDYTKAVVKS